MPKKDSFILALGMKPKGKKGEEDSAEMKDGAHPDPMDSEEGGDKLEAAKDVAMAIKGGDFDAVAKKLVSLVEVCTTSKD